MNACFDVIASLIEDSEETKKETQKPQEQQPNGQQNPKLQYVEQFFLNQDNGNCFILAITSTWTPINITRVIIILL